MLMQICIITDDRWTRQHRNTTSYEGRCKVRNRDQQPLRLKLVVSTTPVQDDFGKLVELASDLDQAANSLPPEEREAYQDNQQSVVDARRSAEVHEGLLQLN
jgi:hypothetical protein